METRTKDTSKTESLKASKAFDNAQGASSAQDYEEDLMARIERTLAEATRTLQLHSNFKGSGVGAQPWVDSADIPLLC